MSSYPTFSLVTEDLQGTTDSSSRDDDSLTPAKEPDITGLSVEQYNTMMTVGNRGFRYYAFSEETSISYIDTIAQLSTALGTGTRLYTMVVPSATDITLPQSFLKDINTSDQQKACEYLNTSLNHVAPNVKTIGVYDSLKANCDKDIYFERDRNWTSLGAYYGYRQFAKVKGITPLSLETMEKKSFEGFVGSFYWQSNYLEEMGKKETILTYYPSDKTTVTVTTEGGDTEKGELILSSVDDLDAEDLYSVFLGGNHPFASIKNADSTDGTSLLVVKDSIGNPLVPYLVSHYQTIYVVDYRYYDGQLSDLLKQHPVTEILLVQTIESTSDFDAVTSLDNFIGEVDVTTNDNGNTSKADSSLLSSSDGSGE